MAAETKFSRVAFAALVGISLPTLDKWINEQDMEGVIRDPRAFKIDAPVAIQWMLRREVEQAANGTGGKGGDALMEIRRQRQEVALKADKMELARKMKELVPLEDVRFLLASKKAILRQTMINAEARIVMELQAVTDPQEMRQRVRNELRDAVRIWCETMPDPAAAIEVEA